ncbi:lysozyme [Cupriavidus sp. CV2]|uniref:lysozyme n=1 Tax=Cupriavidus ulmosensis TaxID=3065913 RepID=UPI00296AF782|nr:lysozyme [Cupriavidus sp. CV2]MDW3682923.1 lysozyme [Cupriavidus sp. CV2]
MSVFSYIRSALIRFVQVGALRITPTVDPGVLAPLGLAAISEPAPVQATPSPKGFNALAVDVAAALARRFEGLYLCPYLCPAGVPTIGYGATRYLDGRAVTLNDPPITREVAEAMLLEQVRTIYLPAVLKLCPGVDTPERLAALIDFAFNLGAGNLRASTLRKRVNAGRWSDVPAEFRKWVRGGGRVLRGLVLRREAEADLI